MATLSKRIEELKQKPHHVRKRAVFSIAGGATALIALIWLIGNLSFGTFALQGSNFAESTRETSVVKSGNETQTGIAGAASAIQNTNVPAQIQIVDTTASSSISKKAEPTIIPF